MAAPDLSVIVVVDEAAHRRATVELPMASRDRIEVLVVDEDGLARAAASASAAWVLLVEGDVDVPEPLVQRHIERHRPKGQVIVASPISHVGTGSGALVAASVDDRPVSPHNAVFGVPADRLRRVAPGSPGSIAVLVGRLLDDGLGFEIDDDVAAVRTLPAQAHLLLREARRAGARDMRFATAAPGAIRRLRLGSLADEPADDVVLLRVLLALHVPARCLRLAFLGGRMPVHRAIRVWRILENLSYWRGVRQVAEPAMWRRLTRPPLILTYHAVGRRHERSTMYTVSRRRFRWQMRYLRWARHVVVPLEELVMRHVGGELVPAGSIAITFDDGYQDVADVAAPLLVAAQHPATVFVVTSLMGGTNDWDDRGELLGRPMFDWDEARRLEQLGVTIASHTHRHPRLTTLGPADVRDELDTARTSLHAHLARPGEVFAYPFGDHDDETGALVRAAGHVGACTVRPGAVTPGTPPFELPRHTVAGVEGLCRFAIATRFGGLPSRIRSRRRPGRTAS